MFEDAAQTGFGAPLASRIQPPALRSLCVKDVVRAMGFRLLGDHKTWHCRPYRTQWIYLVQSCLPSGSNVFCPSARTVPLIVAKTISEQVADSIALNAARLKTKRTGAHSAPPRSHVPNFFGKADGDLNVRPLSGNYVKTVNGAVSRPLDAVLHIENWSNMLAPPQIAACSSVVVERGPESEPTLEFLTEPARGSFLDPHLPFKNKFFGFSALQSFDRAENEIFRESETQRLQVFDAMLRTPLYIESALNLFRSCVFLHRLKIFAELAHLH